MFEGDKLSHQIQSMTFWNYLKLQRGQYRRVQAVVVCWVMMADSNRKLMLRLPLLAFMLKIQMPESRQTLHCNLFEFFIHRIGLYLLNGV